MASDPVVDAVKVIREGGIVVVVDDEDRENEGDLVIAAQHTTPEAMAFFVRNTSGFICTAITSDRADALNLPLMVPHNTERQRTAFAVTVDYSNGRVCGASAVDRARTARALGDTRMRPEDFERPGHMHVLRAEPLGVLRRPGHTEAAVDLARLAGLTPAGVLCELVTQDGLGMARGEELEVFAAEHGLPLIRIEDLIGYRRTRERLVTLVAENVLPTNFGEFRALEYESLLDGSRLVALVMGSPSAHRGTLLEIHKECLAGNVFGSRACSCGQELDSSLCRISQARDGIVVYLRSDPHRTSWATDPRHAARASDGRSGASAGRHHKKELDVNQRCAVAHVLADLGVTDAAMSTGCADSAWTDLGIRLTSPVSCPHEGRRGSMSINNGFADTDPDVEGL